MPTPLCSFSVELKLIDEDLACARAHEREEDLERLMGTNIGAGGAGAFVAGHFPQPVSHAESFSRAARKERKRRHPRRAT